MQRILEVRQRRVKGKKDAKRRPVGQRPGA